MRTTFVSSIVFAAATITSATLSADPSGEKIVSSKMLKVIEQVTPDYPIYADRTSRDGHVLLEFTVTEDGTVLAPAVRETTGNMFSKAALAAIEDWQFEPVLDNGIAVPVRTNLKFTFVPRTE